MEKSSRVLGRANKILTALGWALDFYTVYDISPLTQCPASRVRLCLMVSDGHAR